jgi:hypothetical protein
VVVVVGLDCVRQVDCLLRPLNFVRSVNSREPRLYS